MRAAYAIGHHLPCTRGQACQKLFRWLKANAVWEGGTYTDVVIGEAFRPEGYTPVSCHDAELLELLRMSNPAQFCVCVCVCVCVCGVGAPNTM